MINKNKIISSINPIFIVEQYIFSVSELTINKLSEQSELQTFLK